MKKLKDLGNKSKIPKDPTKFKLGAIKNPHEDLNYVVRLSTPEFTSICPITGQPDFGNIVIDYIPKKLIIESKSFKLFLTSFRNFGAFHEKCTLMIAKKIVKTISPNWLRISGFWNPRGGIPIDIFYQTKRKPEEVWINEFKVNDYKGR